MKRIKDQLSLSGKLETISMTDFRSNPGEVIESVKLGKVFIITKGGKSKPVAVLSAPPGQNLTMVVKPNGKVTYSL